MRSYSPAYVASLVQINLYKNSLQVWTSLIQTLSSARYGSHPLACRDPACSHGDGGGTKELHRHICLLRSRLRTDNTNTLLAKASHKINLGLRSEEIDSASLARELQNHTMKSLAQGYTLDYTITFGKPPVTPLPLLPRNCLVSFTDTIACIASPCFSAYPLQI